MLGVCSCNSIDGTEFPNAICCDEDAWEASNASNNRQEYVRNARLQNGRCSLLVLIDEGRRRRRNMEIDRKHFIWSSFSIQLHDKQG
jgi:hypothetical protein